MSSLTKQCAKCGKEFLIIEQEQKFLEEKQLPLPTNCPSCRQTRRLMIRGGRELFRTTCDVCSKSIITSYDPEKTTQKILCKEDYDKYFEENDPIIKDPLPEV